MEHRSQHVAANRTRAAFQSWGRSAMQAMACEGQMERGALSCHAFSVCDMEQKACAHGATQAGDGTLPMLM